MAKKFFVALIDDSYQSYDILRDVIDALEGEILKYVDVTSLDEDFYGQLVYHTGMVVGANGELRALTNEDLED